MAVIPHAEMYFGGWYIAAACIAWPKLANVARSLGCDIQVKLPGLAHDIVESAKVRGVTLDGGETIDADVVIANSDVVYTYRELLDAGIVPNTPMRGWMRLIPAVAVWSCCWVLRALIPSWLITQSLCRWITRTI